MLFTAELRKVRLFKCGWEWLMVPLICAQHLVGNLWAFACQWDKTRHINCLLWIVSKTGYGFLWACPSTYLICPLWQLRLNNSHAVVTWRSSIILMSNVLTLLVMLTGNVVTLMQAGNTTSLVHHLRNVLEASCSLWQLEQKEEWCSA